MASPSLRPTSASSPCATSIPAMRRKSKTSKNASAPKPSSGPDRKVAHRPVMRAVVKLVRAHLAKVQHLGPSLIERNIQFPGIRLGAAGLAKRQLEGIIHI